MQEQNGSPGSGMKIFGGEYNLTIDQDDKDTPMETTSTNTPPSNPNDELDLLGDMEFDDIWSAPTSPPEEQTPQDEVTKESEVEDDGVEVGAAKYELRPQARELKSRFSSTWIDQDQTGDFDPSEEARKARLQRKRMRLRKEHSVFRTAEIGEECEADDESEPKVIPTLMVEVSFLSETGRSKFKDLVDSLSTKEKPTDDGIANGYRLRKRKAATAFNYNDEYDAERARASSDLPNDLTGHPVARGCWGCVALGNHKCSLISDERTWPCVTCLEDDNDCELITKPIRKRACERCKRRRSACSYNYTLNHGQACQQCMDDGHRCVAGPAKDTIRQRIRYDRDYDIDPIPRPKTSKVRKDGACKECDEADILCSTPENETADQACSACLTTGKPCTFSRMVPQQSKKADTHAVAREQKVQDDDDHGKKAGPTAKAADVDRKAMAKAALLSSPTKAPPPSRGSIKIIRTKFCHPIVFNYEDETNGSKPCHFCAEAGFALLGLETKEVEVIDWQDGEGFEEVSGGHKGAGVTNTRMCTSCTLSRLPIIMCPKHEMRPILGSQVKASDTQAALLELFSGGSKEKRQWCSICLSLAQYSCTTACNGRGGCGLKLCEHCTISLVGDHDGDLQEMLPKLKDEPTGQSLGLRADFELLKQDELLMRYVLWSSRQSAPSG